MQACPPPTSISGKLASLAGEGLPTSSVYVFFPAAAAARRRRCTASAYPAAPKVPTCAKRMCARNRQHYEKADVATPDSDMRLATGGATASCLRTGSPVLSPLPLTRMPTMLASRAFSTRK